MFSMDDSEFVIVSSGTDWLEMTESAAAELGDSYPRPAVFDTDCGVRLQWREGDRQVHFVIRRPGWLSYIYWCDNNESWITDDLNSLVKKLRWMIRR